MGLHELLSTLREDAAAQRAKVLSDAQAEASRIRMAAAADSSRRRADFISRVSAEAEAAAQRTLARTQAEALQSVLGARGRLLERVRGVVEARITEAAEDEDYLATLAEELHESIDRLPPSDTVIRVSPGLVPALARASAAVSEAAAIEEAREIGTGFVVRADSGRVEVDATLEARLAQAWPRLAVAVLMEAVT